MKKTICGFLLFFTFVTVCFAQQNDSNTDEKNGGNVVLKAGTEISAKLEKTLDVETAKNNDDFVLKLTEDVSGNGVKIDKNSEVLGGVVRVKKSSSDDDVSEISIYFDFLKSGDDYLPFKATVISVTPEGGAPVEVQLNASPVFKGATVISAKGNKLQLKEGLVLQLKLDKDLIKK